MTARIVKVESYNATWYEIQLRVLWVFWLDANILKPGFASIYTSFDDALDHLGDLKRIKLKRSVKCTVKL